MNDMADEPASYQDVVAADNKKLDDWHAAVKRLERKAVFREKHGDAIWAAAMRKVVDDAKNDAQARKYYSDTLVNAEKALFDRAEQIRQQRIDALHKGDAKQHDGQGRTDGNA